MRRPALVAALAAATAGLVSFAPAGLASSSGPVSPHGVMIPTHSHLLSKHNDTQSSANWSGYVTAPGSGITGVTSTFRVPDVNPLPPGFSANWTGIGGWNTSDLIQAGTSQDALEGDYAWYELLPDTETPLTNCTGDSNCTVNAGDSISVDIHKVTGSTWSISMQDGNSWSWQQNVTYNSSESSAEWIFEAPTLAVVQTIPANTGTNYFALNGFTDGSGTHDIGSVSPNSLIQVDMGLGVINEATPSALSGQAFNVCAYAQSCPAP
jgi:hypothetical protein